MNSIPTEQLESLRKHNEDYYRQMLESLFEQKRDFFVNAIANRLREIGLGSSGLVMEESEEESEDWVQVESLSGLRSIVGGRFQNLKKRWVNAGFPLKAHRGDKKLDYDLDEDGWIELSGWILKQGFESRLSNGKTEFVFELRKIQD